MFDLNSGLPDISALDELEKSIYDFVLEKWPATAIEIAEHLNEGISTREEKRRMSSKYNYYLKKLVGKGLLLSKKAGNTLIVWPVLVEKYRVVHEILKGEKYEHSMHFLNYLKEQESAENKEKKEKRGVLKHA